MAFIKLSNPKPGAAATAPEGVSVLCRQLTRKKPKKGGGEPVVHRFALIRIGAVIARKAGMNKDNHRCHVLLGDGLERNRCGATLDDSKGEFKVKRLANGDYQLALSERATVGMLNLAPRRYEAAAELVPIAAGQPLCIMFDLAPGMRNA